MEFLMMYITTFPFSGLAQSVLRDCVEFSYQLNLKPKNKTQLHRT